MYKLVCLNVGKYLEDNTQINIEETLLCINYWGKNWKETPKINIEEISLVCINVGKYLEENTTINIEEASNLAVT